MGTLNELPLHERFSLDEAESALIAGAEANNDNSAQVNKVRAWSAIYATANVRFKS